jgi:hypothetical protein
MPFSDLYRRQAALLIRVLPHVAQEKAVVGSKNRLTHCVKLLF